MCLRGQGHNDVAVPYCLPELSGHLAGQLVLVLAEEHNMVLGSRPRCGSQSRGGATIVHRSEFTLIRAR